VLAGLAQHLEILGGADHLHVVLVDDHRLRRARRLVREVIRAALGDATDLPVVLAEAPQSQGLFGAVGDLQAVTRELGAAGLAHLLQRGGAPTRQRATGHMTGEVGVQPLFLQALKLLTAEHGLEQLVERDLAADHAKRAPQRDTCPLRQLQRLLALLRFVRPALRTAHLVPPERVRNVIVHIALRQDARPNP